nr:hypothetical protein [Granulosicoccus sp.]
LAREMALLESTESETSETNAESSVESDAESSNDEAATSEVSDVEPEASLDMTNADIELIDLDLGDEADELHATGSHQPEQPHSDTVH